MNFWTDLEEQTQFFFYVRGIKKSEIIPVLYVFQSLNRQRDLEFNKIVLTFVIFALKISRYFTVE